MWKTLRSSEDSLPRRLGKKMTRGMRRKRYDRLPLDPDHPGFAVRMPRKIKVASLGGRRTKKTPQGLVPEKDASPPSLWGKVRDAYVNMMFKTADDASATSVVPVAKKLDRSLTLGAGFGTKIEVIPTDLSRLGFTLNKVEKEYLNYLKRTFDSRYA